MALSPKQLNETINMFYDEIKLLQQQIDKYQGTIKVLQSICPHHMDESVPTWESSGEMEGLEQYTCRICGKLQS